MNAKPILLAMTAVALLAGCNRGSANNSAKAANTSNATAAAPVAPAPVAPAAPAQPAAATEPVDESFLTANPWAPAGMCANARTFHPDGTVTAGEDGGNWELEGATLTLSQEGTDVTEVWTVARSGSDLVLSGPANMTVSPCPAG